MPSHSAPKTSLRQNNPPVDFTSLLKNLHANVFSPLSPVYFEEREDHCRNQCTIGKKLEKSVLPPSKIGTRAGMP